MGMDITWIEKIIKARKVKSLHFTYRHVSIEFNGISLFDDGICSSWGFQIENAPPNLIDQVFLTDIKEAAKKLGNNVQVYISPRVGRPIDELLQKEGFEHWVDDDEDEGYWWPSSPGFQ